MSKLKIDPYMYSPSESNFAEPGALKIHGEIKRPKCLGFDMDMMKQFMSVKFNYGSSGKLIPSGGNTTSESPIFNSPLRSTARTKSVT